MELNYEEMSQGYDERVKLEKESRDKIRKNLGQLTEDQQKLAEDNIDLVHYLIHKKCHYALRVFDYDDVFQQGCLGLCIAAKYFDPELGYQFSTYASCQITGYIHRYYRDYGSLIRIPRDINDLKYKVFKYRESHKDATDQEIMEVLDITSEQLSECTINIISTDDPLVDKDGADSKVTIIDKIIYNDPDISETELFDLISKVTSSSVSKYSQSHQDICEEYMYSTYFGFNMTQVELAKKYGTSQVQVSRILRKFKNDLKKYLKREGYFND